MRFHIVKRDSCPFWKKLCLYLAAVAGALVLGGLLLLRPLLLRAVTPRLSLIHI